MSPSKRITEESMFFHKCVRLASAFREDGCIPDTIEQDAQIHATGWSPADNESFLFIGHKQLPKGISVYYCTFLSVEKLEIQA